MVISKLLTEGVSVNCVFFRENVVTLVHPPSSVYIPKYPSMSVVRVEVICVSLKSSGRDVIYCAVRVGLVPSTGDRYIIYLLHLIMCLTFIVDVK